MALFSFATDKSNINVDYDSPHYSLMLRSTSLEMWHRPIIINMQTVWYDSSLSLDKYYVFKLLIINIMDDNNSALVYISSGCRCNETSMIAI